MNENPLSALHQCNRPALDRCAEEFDEGEDCRRRVDGDDGAGDG